MTGRRDLATNICPVTFGADAFRVQARDIAEAEDLGALRQAHAGKWSVQWEQGQVFFLPLAGGLPVPEGTEPVQLEVAGNLRLMARLTTEALVRAFPDYEPLRRKPFVFIGRRQELMRDAAQVLDIDSDLLGDFRIWPKYSLDARVLEVRDGSPFVGITVDLATRWEIVSGLEELQDVGVDLTGLFVVRRDPDPGQRRLVGRIAAVRAGRVELSESTDGAASADVKSVMLEGRREAFARCLRHLLGRDYRRYEQYRDKQMGAMLDGPAQRGEVTRVGQVLRKRRLELMRGLTCSVGPPLVVTNSPEYQSVVTARSAATPSRGRPRASWSSSPRPRRAPPRNSSATSATAYPGSRASRPASPRPSGSSTRAST